MATVQAIGGTGGLEDRRRLPKSISPDAKVLISDPSWENHRAIFTNAGFEVGSYRYYDAATRLADFDGITDLQAAAPGTIAVLHACCQPHGLRHHARSGDKVIEVVGVKGPWPSPTWPTRVSATVSLRTAPSSAFPVAAGLNIFVPMSFSKSFSLYGERVARCR